MKSGFVRLTADREYLLAQGRKAALAAETVNAPHGVNSAPGIVTAAAAAAAAGVTRSAVTEAISLKRHRPDLFVEVRAGRMTLGQAQYVRRKAKPKAKAKERIAYTGKAMPAIPRGAARHAALVVLVRNLATVIDECGGPPQAAALALCHGLSVDGRKVARAYEFLAALAAAMEAGQAA